MMSDSRSLTRVVSYFLLSLLFSEGFLGSSRGFEFLSFPELINNATHLYGPPIDTNRSTNDLLDMDGGHILFPCMNFGCSGRIIKLMFIAPVIGDQWPQFWLLRKRNCELELGECYRTGIDLQGNVRLSTSNQHRSLRYHNRDFGVYELDFGFSMNNYTFESDDFLGVSYPTTCESRCQRRNILYQNGGGFCEATVVYSVNGQSKRVPILPYIALETDAQENSELCEKKYYLNERSLKSIIEASCDSIGYINALSFTPAQEFFHSVPLSKSGNTFKLLLASRFNYSVTSNSPSTLIQEHSCPLNFIRELHPPWPTIEIRRITKFSGTPGPTVPISICHEPRPSGYLNVFEYELTGDIQAGDVVRIQVPWTDSTQTSIGKHVLAYLGESQPMVYIDNGEHPESANATPCDDSNEHDDNAGTDSNDISTNSMSENENMDMIAGISQHVVWISSGLICTLVLIAIMVTVVIAFVLIHQRKKNLNSFSPRSDVLDNVYVHNEMLRVGDQRVGNREAESGEHDGEGPSASNDQQEDYYFYKVYEWGVFVPTVAEREAATATVTNTEADVDALYSTLGESQYSTLLQFNQSPDFFHESDDYWTPASDERSLYQQLSSKKFREILRSQIETSNQLGSGEFGTVMKGVWLLSGGSKEVAVKVLKEGSSEEDKVKFLQEAAINGQFWHPNVVRLVGVVTVGEPTMIVLEYLTNGDLRNYVMKMQPTPGEMVSTNTPHTLLRFCKEIASGMKYLAQKKFVHRDLAARNILLSEEKTCKIGDFGMSRNLEDDSYYVSHGGMIPVKWTAPEALHYKKYSTSSDVWSFGALLYEIWSLGHKPFERYSNREVMRKVDAGFRLPPPPGCPRDIYQLMITCWHPDKSQRPSFSELHASLSDHGLSLQLRDSDTDAKLHPLALTIGAPLESSKELYTDLQNTYT